MFDNFIENIKELEKFFPLLVAIFAALVVYALFNLALRALRKALLQKAKSKKQVAGIEVFSRLFKYVFLFLLVIVVSFYYSKSWTGLGIGIGLFSAALGWALQKPITGIAGWLMVLLKRPFMIGDRVIIGSVKGDVLDITLTHIYLREVGGIVPAEESSGRVIMVPNSVLFEQSIVNYTLRDEYVLDQISLTVTFESDLDSAVGLCQKAIEQIRQKRPEIIKKDPYIRINFQPNGIGLHIRYYAQATRLQEISSYATQEVFALINSTSNVNLAYPRTDVFLNNQNNSH